MAKAIHMMIRVLELDRSIAFYRTALALQVRDRYDFDGFTLVYLGNDENEFELELTWNKGREQAYASGEGYGHLACSVADLDAEHHRLSEAGLRPDPIRDFMRDGALMARFFFLTDPDGYRVKVVQRHGRYV